jgi:transportin-1
MMSVSPQGLMHLSNDESPEIKVLVCQSLITLTEVRLEYVKQYLPAFIDCVLVMTRDDDETVALEATEFWPVIAETRMCTDILRANLGRILPALLDGMVYSDSEIADFEAEEEDENVPDKAQDIKPFVMFGNRGRGGDDDDDDDYEPEEWSLRKCSAAGLDIFASEFGEEILPIVLPIIFARLQDVDVEQWQFKESAILALGAVAEGCSPAIEQYLPQTTFFLLQQSSHPKVIPPSFFFSFLS